jgi:hypothetical protein
LALNSLSSYIAKHWQGRLSLPVSFWINGFVLTVALNEVINIVPWVGLATEYPRSYSWVIIVLWSLVFPFGTWQLYGVWRSATSYLREGKPQLWGRLAQAMVAIGAARLLLEICLVGIPQLIQHSQLAMGRDPLGSYELRILEDATELQVTGVIASGLSGNIRTVLAANPRIDTIRLNSNGGRTIEARRVRDLIDAKALSTSTSTGCFSACTLAFAAGQQRLIARQAKLGFHRYYFPGITGIELQRQYEIDKRDWRSRGFDASMIDRAFSTAEIWTPTNEDLLKWRVITGFVPNS